MASAATAAARGPDTLAVPFIVYDNDTKRFEVGTEAINFLAGIDEQIGEWFDANARVFVFLQLSGAIEPTGCAFCWHMIAVLVMCAATVIIAGRYRSGKSLLMGQLTGMPGEFAVGHTVQGHTQVRSAAIGLFPAF